MKEKRRCSILFHLLVPGGRWVTTMSRPSSLASFCSSRFHSRTREPLLPPPSAVMLFTAKAAVSWSTPTLTHPAFAARSWELVGDFRNNGREYRPHGCPEEVRVHDFLIKELGRAVPYGVLATGSRRGNAPARG